MDAEHGCGVVTPTLHREGEAFYQHIYIRSFTVVFFLQCAKRAHKCTANDAAGQRCCKWL